MIKAIIDTCVIIDYLFDRIPFSNEAEHLFEHIVCEKIEGYICAKSLTDIYYIAHKYTHSDTKTRDILNVLLDTFTVLDTTAEDIANALNSSIHDYENAVIVETAKRCNIEYIVTRNIKDLSFSTINIKTPSEMIDIIYNDDMLLYDSVY